MYAVPPKHTCKTVLQSSPSARQIQPHRQASLSVYQAIRHPKLAVLPVLELRKDLSQPPRSVRSTDIVIVAGDFNARMRFLDES
ncbi:unnamed protein product [Echinostoma caproni]|uniref:Endonuclease/exonuclease/phosphatase domain-containing protein n=1 Tax=Echinostoma caproni TaxID=27848 RepID=A0A183B5W9_9TREM|nr:unnamed protein product [Echinostoma caproni]